MGTPFTSMALADGADETKNVKGGPKVFMSTTSRSI
jgi:hypothetical protein